MWLKHSKGPWKEHKYVRKEGEGKNAKYYYTSVLDGASERIAEGWKDIAENQYNPNDPAYRAKQEKKWKEQDEKINEMWDNIHRNRDKRLREYVLKDDHSTLEKIRFGVDFVSYYSGEPVVQLFKFKAGENPIRPDTYLGIKPNIVWDRPPLPGEKEKAYREYLERLDRSKEKNKEKR